jgi:DHA1 family bicyclomycin/chloramphenicol resistance-like MFS transporter
MEAHPRSTLIIWILGALATVSPFAIDLYLPAFADLARDFKTSQARISLSISSYFIGMALGQILYGPLLDRFGRKPPLYAGLLIFLVSSMGCMLAKNIELLVAFRFVQALGGSVAWVAAVAMVRDFFPVAQSARIFSLLVLILGVSPLLAPTAGVAIVGAWGWQAVFLALAVIVVLILLLVLFLLPEGQKADASVSLRLRPISATFLSILKEPQFSTYSFAGAFSFATLFIYVAGSPVIFMEGYRLSREIYGILFAALSLGFIGASQFNVLLSRYVASDKIVRSALITQVATSMVFLAMALGGWLSVYFTPVFIFICLACIGLGNPNASALALAPFNRNIGSASALMGFIQIGIAAVSSAGVGLFESGGIVPVVILLAATSSIALVILLLGSQKIGRLPDTENSAPPLVAH